MKRWLRVAIPILILALLIGWRIGQKRAEVAGQTQQRAARMKAPAVVSLAPVQIRDVVHTFGATGSVEAPLSVKIAPKITGRIVFLEVREGDRIRKGQMLVKIDSYEVEANVQQARAALAENQYRLAQAQIGQNPADVAVNTQLRQQKAAKASAQADYNQASKNYEAQLVAATANLTDADSRIENARASITGAEANLTNAKTRYARVDSLHKQGYIATQAVDDAKAAVAVQEAALEIAKGQLKSAGAQKESAQQQYNITKEKGKADVEAAKAKLEQAQASYEYALANTSQKSAYRQSIEALKATVNASKAALESAQARRRDTALVSPLEGFVTGRYADPGAIASPTQPILVVQFVKQVWVTIAVPEEVCAKIHLGQPATISFDALPGRIFDASVVQINPSADPQSRQFTVRVIMTNKDDLLKPGMFAHVAVETERIRGAVVVPREAVRADRSGSYVIAAGRDNKARRVSVTPGVEDVEFVSIGDALKPGEKVVTMSSFPVREGQMLVSGGGRGRGSKGRPGGARAR